MVLTEKQVPMGTGASREKPACKPQPEKLARARFLVTSPGSPPCELPLTSGECVHFLNRKITLVSAFPEEDSLSLSSPPIAEVSISHMDGTGKNTYSVEKGDSFKFGQYTFTLEKVE